MSLIHRILYAIRSLAEEEPKENRHKRRRRPKSSRAVALVITIHDLFSSKGISHLLEDPRPPLPADFPLDLTFPPVSRPSEAWFRETPAIEAPPMVPSPKAKPSEAWLTEAPPLPKNAVDVRVKSRETSPKKVGLKRKSSKAWFKSETPPEAPSKDMVMTLSTDSKVKSLKAWLKRVPPLKALPNNAVVFPLGETKVKSAEAWINEAPPLKSSLPKNAVVSLHTDTKVPEAWYREAPPLQSNTVIKVKSSGACFEMAPPLGTERVLASSEASLVNAVVAMPPDLRITPSEAWFLMAPPFVPQCIDDDRQRAVVENAVNRVREEQLKKKRKLKFFRLKFC